MSGKHEEKYRRRLLILLLGGISISAIFVIFGSYRSVRCSSLCISNFSLKEDYSIRAAINYMNHSLPNTEVLVLINNKYEETLKTNPESTLDFKPPLKIGLNLIKVEYGGSESSIELFYMGGMLYLLLIPLGAIFFLLIRVFTSTSNLGNWMAFYSNERASITSDSVLNYALDSTVLKSKMAVHNLPEKLSNVSSELSLLSQIGDRKRITEDVGYLSKKFEILGVGRILFNCIGHSHLTKQIAGAKIFYEKSILLGFPMVLKPSLKEFIEANNLLLPSDLSLQKISKLKSRQKKINLLVLDDEENHHLSREFRSYSKLGAALLIMKLTNTIKIVGQR